MNKERFSIKNIDWGKIAKSLRDTLISIGKGDFLLRLRVDKLFPYILVLFVLAFTNIWLSYEVEQTALKVEKNKKVLETYKIHHAHLTGEIVELNRLSTIEKMLQDMGSEIRIPEKPADKIR